MVMNQEQLSKITKVLKDNPRGMTITQISKEINLNRNSVAKYLEVLLISGHVEMKSYGPAKVFFMSQRVPMSAMIDFSSDYILILDRDLKITNINDNFLKLVGIEREAILGQRIEDGSLPVFNTPEMMSKLKATLNGKGTTQEIEFLTDEEKQHFKIKLISTTFEDGLPGVTIILENITERKKMERKLKKSEERYRKQFEEALDAIFLADAETGILVDCNPAATKLVGRAKSEIIDKHQRILHPPEEIEGKFSRTFSQHLKEKEGQVLEAQVITKNGEIRDVEIKANFFEVGNKRLLQGIFRDVTERKKSENELKESEEKFRNLAEQSPNMIFINQEGRIVYANRKCEELMGYTKEEFYSPDFNFYDLISPEFIATIKSSFFKHLKGEEVDPYEYSLITKDGKRIEAILTTKIITYQGKNAILGTVTDITERKKRENELILLSNAVKMSTDSIVITDINATIIDVNEAALKMYGATDKRDLIGKNSFDFMALEDQEKASISLKEVLEKGYQKTQEFRFVTPEGTKKIIELILGVMKDADGKAIGFVIVSREIPGHKKTK